MALSQGALIVLSLPPALGRIKFQYNPESVSRTMKANISEEKAGLLGKSFKGQADESISMQIKVQAVDDYSKGEAPNGLIPILSALDMLVNPTLVTYAISQAAYAVGSMIIQAPPVPNVTLQLGTRFIPVMVTNFTAKETAFDPELNPIEAEVDLSMQVLTFNDANLASPVTLQYGVYEAYREVMAGIYFVKSVASDLQAAAGMIS